MAPGPWTQSQRLRWNYSGHLTRMDCRKLVSCPINSRHKKCSLSAYLWDGRYLDGPTESGADFECS